jgi:hypothetical protein
MALSLKQSRALQGLAKAFYSFLPGSGNPAWKGHVSFKTIAAELGLGAYWQEGSKEPMITALLERTLTKRSTQFEPLIVAIVRGGLVYREKQGTPISAQEIKQINGFILELGFKFPQLWDTDFMESLATPAATSATQRFREAQATEATKSTGLAGRNQTLEELKTSFLALHSEGDRQKAGLSLEKLLNRLFALYGLTPREPFKLTGEQIDGSFELENEIYLLEVKWHKEPRPAADLYVFREKIEGKSRYTRGVFISINGVSKEAEIAITTGKQPLFFIVNGHDLLMCLSNSVQLPLFLKARQRLLAEKGLVVVPFGDCRF